MDMPTGLGEAVLILGWFTLGPLVLAFSLSDRFESHPFSEWFGYFTLANWLAAAILSIGAHNDIGLWRAVPLVIFVADCATCVILYREKQQ